MKRTSTLKRGNGFKNKGSSFKNLIGENKLKKSSFKRTLTDTQKEVRETDSKFSKFIINRDQKCLNCGNTYNLSCSHFYGRANYATRYEPNNCITLCIDICHNSWESKKNGIYKDFMIALLGEEKFFSLENQSKMKISKTDSLILANNLLKKVENNQDIQY
jgi:hypothetical protein